MESQYKTRADGQTSSFMFNVFKVHIEQNQTELARPTSVESIFGFSFNDLHQVGNNLFGADREVPD